ncbi:MAG: single-stranded DNA-binding protein [Saprospiraceae bacterium]|nr:single-stranded DNA-binding protein [Saprospiraceae bacterium]
MVNKVTLIGNLGRDPKIRHLENGSMVGKFPVATNESYRDKNGEWQTLTEWHDVVVWRSLAERAEKALKKGSLVYVEGKLTHRKYQDKDGNERYITEVVANTIKPLERREGGSGSYSSSFPAASDAPQGSSYELKDNSSSATPQQVGGGQEDEVDDDLPF